MFVFISCQKDDKIDLLLQEQDNSVIKKAPNSTKNDPLDWENTTTITLGNGNIKTLPWYNGSITEKLMAGNWYIIFAINRLIRVSGI